MPRNGASIIDVEIALKVLGRLCVSGVCDTREIHRQSVGLGFPRVARATLEIITRLQGQGLELFGSLFGSI